MHSSKLLFFSSNQKSSSHPNLFVVGHFSATRTAGGQTASFVNTDRNTSSIGQHLEVLAEVDI